MKSFQNRKGGFTLVEILIATTIVGVVVGMSILIVFQALQTYYYDVGRVEVNADMRKLTRDMTTNAVFSNYYLIYPNFATRTVTTGTGTAATTVDALVNQGGSGDMVLFVSLNYPPDSTTGISTINTIVGYYRDGTTNQAGPVRSFKITVPSTSTQQISSILNTYQPVSNQSLNTTVIPLAQDIGNGLLFYNYLNDSVMVKSQVLEQGADNRQATSTYNFTVTPRG